MGTLVIARIAALSTQALGYFLQAVLNAAIGFQALHLTHLKQRLQLAVTTVQRVWAIHDHRLTSLPAEVREASELYYGDSTDHLVHNGHTAHTAAHLPRLPHNHKPGVREVFTLTLREGQHGPNACPQYILDQQGLPTTIGTQVWRQPQLLLPHQRHVIRPNHRCRKTGPMAFFYTDVGGGPTRNSTILEQVGTTLHLVRVTTSQMRFLQRGRTHHIPFLQHPDWPNKSLIGNHLQKATATAGRPHLTRTIYSGTRTGGPCQRPHHTRTRPTTCRQKRWSTSQKPQDRRSWSWRTTDSKTPCSPARRRATCGCYPHQRQASSVHRRYNKTH